MNKRIVDFYINNKKNIWGKTFDDVLNYNDKQLEEKHGYIQYLFPTFEPSSFNFFAPVLDAETWLYLKENDITKENLKKAFNKMLDFYGFKYTYSNELKCFICELVNKDKLSNWLTPNNHNFKRITRMFKFLRTMSFFEECDAFYSALYDLSLDNKCITDEVLSYWSSASGN